MPFDGHSNFGYSTVATAPSPAASGLSLTLAAGDGAKFNAALPFNVVIWPAGTQPTVANAEVARVTNVVGDVLTITRAQEGSPARTVVVGDQVSVAITAKTLTDLEAMFSPDLALSFLTSLANELIPASFSGIVNSDYEIVSGNVLELAAEGLFEVQ